MHIDDSNNIVLSLAEAKNLATALTTSSYSTTFDKTPLLFLKFTKELIEISGCPFTFSHTKHWCGHPDCRDS